MSLSLLFRMKPMCWDMVIINAKENIASRTIDPASRYFVVTYATQADCDNAIARLDAVPNVVLPDTTTASLEAAYSSLLTSQ